MKTIKVSDDLWQYLQKLKIEHKARSIQKTIEIELGRIKSERS